MFFTPIKYQFYKLICHKQRVSKSKYIEHVIGNETLVQLKTKFKRSNLPEISSKILIDSQKHSFDLTLFDILNKYGKPFYLGSNKTGKIKHDVMLYKQMMHGIKTRIIYNFVNNKIATIAFQFTIFSPAQLESIQKHLSETFAAEPLPKTSHFNLRDQKGNRLEYNYTFDLGLTFYNYDPAIIHCINASMAEEKLYEEKLHQVKDFQISI